MKINDPFLNSVGIVFHRFCIGLVFAIIGFLILWSAVFERGLDLSWTEAFSQLPLLVHGQADSTTTTLAKLTLAVAFLFAYFIASALFAYWKRQGDLPEEHVRGSRLEK